MELSIKQFILTKINSKYRRVLNNPQAIAEIAMPSENLQLLAVKLDYNVISLISTPSERALAEVIYQEPNRIKFIDNPSPKLQMLAVMRNPDTLSLIKEPTNKVIMAALIAKPECISTVEKPSTIMQLLAVQKDAMLIKNFPQPDEKVQIAAVLKDPDCLPYINNPLPIAMLIAVEKKFGIKIFPSNENLQRLSYIIVDVKGFVEMGEDCSNFYRDELKKIEIQNQQK